MVDAGADDETHRLRVSVLLALLVHAAVVFGVHFKPPTPPPLMQTLEVTLARFSDARVREADFLAQQDQSGSGDATSIREMRSPSEAPFSADRHAAVPTLPATPTPQPEAPVPRLARLDNSGPAPTETEAAPAPTVPTPGMQQRTPLDAALEVATLNARLAAEAADQARGPRIRRITSVSTRTAVEAYYVQAWRRQIERLGNLNFPEDQNHNRLYGSLRLLVAIDPSGALLEVTVLESSGTPLLDQAAVRIVRLAAPFAPFPPDMRAAMDRLEVIRTWSFRRTAGAGNFAM